MRTCIDFNDNWALLLNGASPFTEEHTDAEYINLPHILACSDTVTCNEEKINGIWYVKTLSLTDSMKEEQIFLEAAYAAHTASLYINGEAILHHSGSATLFRENITSYLTKEQNQIAIHVSSEESALDTMEPASDYLGISGHVMLILVSETHFDLTFLGSSGFMVTPIVKENEAILRLISYITAPEENQTVLYEIFDQAGQLITSVTSSALCSTASLTIPSPHLWNGITDPYLYTAKASILYRDFALDSVSIRFGIRSYYIDDDLGFFLNGMAYPLRLPSKNDSALSFQCNDTIEVMRTHLMELKAQGITYLNESSHIHVAAFYDLLDEFGFIASADLLFASDFLDTSESRKDSLARMNELIVQTYNHPSICFYGIANSMAPTHTEYASLDEFRTFCSSLKRLDPTRKFTFPCLKVHDLEFARMQYSQILNYCHAMGWYVC